MVYQTGHYKGFSRDDRWWLVFTNRATQPYLLDIVDVTLNFLRDEMPKPSGTPCGVGITR